MRKHFLLFCLLIVSVLLNAKPVTPTEAAGIAGLFVESNTLQKTHLRRIATRGVQTEQAAYYVFTGEDDKGFIIIAGDDCAYPVLAYSESGSIDMNNLPSNVRSWLGKYESQLHAAMTDSLEATAPIAAEWAKMRQAAAVGSRMPQATMAVEPLITTKWSQDEPYNKYCPYDSKTKTNSAVGCVATAMAQVMNYWKWPKVGQGSHSYTPENSYLGVQEAKFGETHYDWDNMLQYYNYYYENNTAKWAPTATTAQENAVALLMYHCGVAVEMGYSGEESGAYTYSYNGYLEYCAETAFSKFFRYKTSVKGYQKDNGYRNYYSDSEWQNIVKKELMEGRPVMYAGSGDYGGHSFVCDGYNSQNYFHFNFGWAGLADGYFKLNAIDPSVGGTGAGSMHYNSYQDVIVGVEPDYDNSGETTEEPVKPESKTYNLTANYGEATYYPNFGENGKYNYQIDLYHFSNLTNFTGRDVYASFEIYTDDSTHIAGDYNVTSVYNKFVYVLSAGDTVQLSSEDAIFKVKLTYKSKDSNGYLYYDVTASVEDKNANVYNLTATNLAIYGFKYVSSFENYDLSDDVEITEEPNAKIKMQKEIVVGTANVLKTNEQVTAKVQVKNVGNALYDDGAVIGLVAQRVNQQVVSVCQTPFVEFSLASGAVSQEITLTADTTLSVGSYYFYLFYWNTDTNDWELIDDDNAIVIFTVEEAEEEYSAPLLMASDITVVGALAATEDEPFPVIPLGTSPITFKYSIYNSLSTDFTGYYSGVLYQYNFTTNKWEYLTITDQLSGTLNAEGTYDITMNYSGSALAEGYYQFLPIFATKSDYSDLAFYDDTYYDYYYIFRVAAITSSDLGQTETLSVTLYPNPATDYLQVQCQSQSGQTQLEILTLTGVVVWTQSVSGDAQQTVNVSRFPRGEYILRLTDGKHQQVKKFIKQ